MLRLMARRSHLPICHRSWELPRKPDSLSGLWRKGWYRSGRKLVVAERRPTTSGGTCRETETMVSRLPTAWDWPGVGADAEQRWSSLTVGLLIEDIRGNAARTDLQCGDILLALIQRHEYRIQASPIVQPIAVAVR